MNIVDDARGPASGAEEDKTAIRVRAWPAFKGEDVQPYPALFGRALRAKGALVADFELNDLFRARFDVLHVHWPEFALPRNTLNRPTLRMARFLLGLPFSRFRGVKVVWTVHNLSPHAHGRRQGAVAGLFWWLFPRMVDAFVALSRAGVPAILDRFPALRGKPYSVMPHGHYLGAYPDAVTRQEARQRLGIPETATVHLFFGQIRAYKNVPALISSFRALTESDAVLVVAGSVDGEELAAAIRTAAGEDPRVRLHLRFVAAEEVQVFLRAADVVVLPFTEVFNSGSAMLALSFDRPVLLPDTPTFRELQAIVGDRWVHLFGGELGPEDLADAPASTAAGERPPLAPFGWDIVGERTLDLYRRIG